MFLFGGVTIGTELAVVYRLGVRSGLFMLDSLPLWGKMYVFSILFALVASAVKLAMTSAIIEVRQKKSL